MEGHIPTHRLESHEESALGPYGFAQPTGDRLAVRTRLPVLKLGCLRTIMSGRTRRPMASSLTSMPQELSSPFPDHTANEKQSPSTTPSDGDKAVMAVDDVVSSLPNKEVDTRVVTKAMRRKGWIQFAAICWAIFVCGWNDGTTGPLIPRLREVYRVCGTLVAVSTCHLLTRPFLGIIRCPVPHFHRRLRCTFLAILYSKLHAINHQHDPSRVTSPVPLSTSTSQTVSGMVW